MNTISAFTRSDTEHPFWHLQFNLRQNILLRAIRRDFDDADTCRLHVTTKKAMKFQDDIPSIPFDNFKEHCVLLSDLTLMQDATEKCHYPEIVGEALRLELNFTFPVEYVTELIVPGERRSSVAVDRFDVFGKKIYDGLCLSSASNQPYPAAQVSVPWFNSLGLCSNFWWWHLCHYKYANQQNVGWALDIDCKFS